MRVRNFIESGLIASVALAAEPLTTPLRTLNGVAPTDPPVVTPVGQVIDRTVPVYAPKFLQKPQPVGRYEERKYAYLYTYAAYPFYGYGGFWGGYGFGGYRFGYGYGGGGWTGGSIQTSGYTR